jgi:hypothetical protein
MTISARDKTRIQLLSSGMADWVHLGEIHYQVEQDNPDFTVQQIQRETLDTIRSLVLDGLFEIGDLSGPNGQFAAWDTPLEDSIERISAAYIGQFANETAWLWVFWLGITDMGRYAAAKNRL